MKSNKYIYAWVIKIWTSAYGWEDVCTYYKHECTYSSVLHDLKEYQMSDCHPYRLVSRRIPA